MSRFHNSAGHWGRASAGLTGPSRRSVLRAAGFGALTLGAGSLLAACGGADEPGGAAQTAASGALTKPTPFTIASSPGDNYFLDTVCKEKKLFDKYNLKVPDFVFPQSGVQAMQLFAGGTITGMQQDTVLTMVSYVNGQEGKRPVIVGMRVPETTYSIVVNKGSWPDATASFEERMQALKGKKVGVSAVGAGSDQQLMLALEAAGMQYDDVTHLGVGQFVSGIPQMTAGRLDAYVAVDYGSAHLMAKSAGGSVYLPFWDESSPDILHKQQVQPIIVREDYLKDNRHVIDAWKAAAWEGKEWILANRDEAAAMLNETAYGGRGAEEAKAYIEHYATTVVPRIQPDWKVQKAGIDVMIDVGQKLGRLKEGQITYDQIVADFARA
ncbi:ABC transporter substrate-binding protein [Microtetraspora sp. NBRC 16547]|uniref:ABC transporter substrate-binding protein n=1 Tax=Microtetraspora sp. NBRC 16547 TaxID=3030993 RepID=UPI0024A1020C|nr:ABC transporter substrate-binding protein [Microtetraspora sp. NBRC 16547]GLW99361.1 hypothetical protein Misp02_34480 [Microtetraspora sp. NBRC 16547]